MTKADKIKHLQEQVYDLMRQFSPDQETGAFYGLRLAWESLSLAYYRATGNADGIREKLHSVELALDDFDNFVLPDEGDEE